MFPKYIMCYKHSAPNGAESTNYVKIVKKDLLETKRTGELRPEYDLAKLKGGVRGKYYPQAIEMAARDIGRKRSEVRNLKKHKS